jgi:hypothetical protein
MSPVSPFLAQTSVSDSKIFFGPFIVIWFALAISSFLFFHFNRNTTLKRRVFPPFVVIIGVFFGCFVAYISRGHLQILFVAVPMIVLISFLNIRKTRFCGACGRTLYQQPIFSRSQYCPRCGAELR